MKTDSFLICWLGSYCPFKVRQISLDPIQGIHLDSYFHLLDFARLSCLSLQTEEKEGREKGSIVHWWCTIVHCWCTLRVEAKRMNHPSCPE